jgi:hypothetical protein
MVRLTFALLLTLACGRGAVGSDAAPPDAGRLHDVGGSDAYALTDADMDAAEDPEDVGPSFPETGCSEDRWCWVMGGPIHDVHGVEPDAVFAVGAEGTVRMFDGTTWTDHASPTRGRIDSVVARSADAVWILTEGKVFHYDGADWTIELEDDPAEWPTDMLVLDEDGVLHTARRRYSGHEYWSILQTYREGVWAPGPNRRVVEATPEEDYEALRPSLRAYAHAFDPAFWARVPPEVWVNGARAAWGTGPSDVVVARQEHDAVVWERGSPRASVELARPVTEARPFYRWPQERDQSVAGFADGSALMVHQREALTVTGTTVHPSDESGRADSPRSVRALDDGRVALWFVEEADGVRVGRVRVWSRSSEVRDHSLDFTQCPPTDGFRGLPRLVDVEARGDEVWVSAMMDASRTGTPCLFHFDGDSWAARALSDSWVFQSHGYMLTLDGGDALLFGGGGARGPELVRVPRAYMRSGEPPSSLVRTQVPQAASFGDFVNPRIWRGPTGLWLYENDRALFRGSR